MSEAILIVTEIGFTPADANHLADFYAGQDVTFEVFAPADTKQNHFAEFLNHLVYGEFQEAIQELREPQTPTQAHAEACEELAATLAQLHGFGLTATGQVVSDNPLPALQERIDTGGVREIVVVTAPRALQDTFHTDVASRIREQLLLPVLHMYTGTLSLG